MAWRAVRGLFGPGEQLQYRVPVAGGGRHLEGAIQRRQQFGLPLTLGKVDINLAPAGMDFLLSDIYRLYLAGDFDRRRPGEEEHGELPRVDIRTAGQGVARHHITHLGGRTQHYAGAELAALFDSRLNSRRDFRRVGLGGAENDIAALNIGPRVAQLERHADVPKHFHADLIVATEIDSAQ